MVKTQLNKYRTSQKYHHDQHASKPLPKISGQEAIRVRTDRGWQPAEYIGKSNLPNSYIIKTGPTGHVTRRNRKDIIVTKENPHRITNRPFLNIPRNARPPQFTVPRNNTGPLLVNNHPQQAHVPNPQSPVVLTRTSNRQIRKPNYLKDYVC
jgi:hypothetical protein